MANVVISPIGELGFQDTRMVINGGATGDLTQRLYDAIAAIQYGATNDAHGWMRPVRVFESVDA